jgi:hypothetical protein
MSPRNWAFLLCRILSLYFLILGLQHLLLGTYTVFNLALKNGITLAHLFNFLMLNTNILAFIVLWFGALRISNIMIPSSMNEKTSSDFELEKLMSLLVSLSGLYILATAIASSTSTIHLFFFEKQANMSSSITLLLAHIVVGLIMIVGSKRISNTINFIREW